MVIFGLLTIIWKYYFIDWLFRSRCYDIEKLEAELQQGICSLIWFVHNRNDICLSGRFQKQSIGKELKLCKFDAHCATANRCELASDLLPAEATWSPTMPVSKCPGLGFSSEQHCPSLYPLNWIQSSPNGWKLNSFSFVPRIHFKWRGHGRQKQLLQHCEIEMACHVPWYWARTETWISIVISAQTQGGVNGSRSSVLRVHFLFACHTIEVT